MVMNVFDSPVDNGLVIILLLSTTVSALICLCQGLDNIGCPRLQLNGCGNIQRSTDDRQIITFGLMLSFPDLHGNPTFVSAFDDGHDLAPAAYLAVEQVNERSDLLKGYRINISRFDGGCDAHIRTLFSVTELFCSCEPIVGVIGPSCDRSSGIVSNFTNRAEFAMITINYDSQTHGSQLSDKNQRYSFHIFGPGSIANNILAIANLIEHNNWNNSALLHSGYGDSFVSHTRNKLVKLTNRSGNPFKLIAPIYDDFYIPLKEVQESFTRIIIVIASPLTILRVLCLAYHEGVIFPNYQWVFHQTFDENFHEISFTYDGRTYHCSDSDINSSLHGSINVFLSTLRDDDHPNSVTDADITFEEYRRAYGNQNNVYSNEYGVQSHSSPWAKGFYDAVWVLAIALNNSLADINTHLTELKPGSQVLAESIRSQLLKIDFNGIIGRIKFDNDTGLNREHLMTVSIYQYGPNGSSHKIGSFDDNFTLSNTSMFIKAEFETRHVHIYRYVVCVLLIMTFVTLAIVISAHIINILYRNHRAIKASSPTLNHLIFLGCYMIIVGIIMDVISYDKAVVTLENASDIRPNLCKIFTWLLSVGITLFLGTFCAKTWRLNRIYTTSKELKTNVRFIQGYHLFGFVCILATVDSLICIVWYFIDPFTLLRTKTHDTESEKPLLIVKEICHSYNTVYFFIALLIPKGMVTLASFLMAVSTNINIKEFKTSNIIIVSYLITILFGLGVPLYVIASNEANKIHISVRESLLTVCLNIAVCIGVIFLFLPLVQHIVRSGRICTTPYAYSHSKSL